MAEVYHNNIIDIDLESGTLFRSFLNHTIGSGDNNANWYGVRVFRKGEPIALSGCSVQGLFMPASGSAILISDGTHTWVSGNEAAVLLPQACYNVKGRFTLTIKIIGTNSYSITDTVRIIDGVVADTYSENPVAPTAAVPTYQEILAVYDQMVAAKEGSVRFDIDQTLTAAQMTQARGNIEAASAAEVSDLNSALKENAESLGDALHLSPLAFALIKSGKIIGPTTGDEASNASYSYTANYLPVHAGNQYKLISTGKLYGAWYDSDKMYISGLQYDTASVDATVTAPNNAAFVRASCLTANIDDLDIIPYQVFSSPDVKQANLSISYENYTTYLPTLADAALNSIYNITMRSGSHQPDYPTKMGYTTLTLITIGTSLYKEQYVLPTWVGGACAKRRYYNSAWHDWEYSYDDNARLKRITHVSYTDYESLLPTLADAVPNSVYFITMRANAHPSDYPTSLGYNTYTLLTITDEGLTYKEQYVFPTSPSDKTFAKRRFYSSVWHDWEYFDISNYFSYETMPVYSGNYMTYLPTLADAKMDSVIVLTMSPDAHQEDYPVDMGYTTNELITIGAGTYAIQYMLSADVNGKIAKRRFYSSAWHDWEYTSPSRGSIVIGTGEQYETLAEGLDAAYRIGNCDVTIRPETFNLVAEMQELYGSDYFENESFTNRGILIGKGNKYYFESGSQVNCVLPSSASERAQNLFSPFMSGDGDYEIIGLRVYTEFCRYCVHDEMDGIGNYHHIYKDCYMHQNDIGAGYIQCIGGGLGAHGLIDIDGCVFESDTAESNDEGIVSWHNGSPANIQSFINIRNCYFINGHVRFSWYGESELVSEMCISGCSFKNSIYDVRAENASALIRNISVREWNNEVRN